MGKREKWMKRSSRKNKSWGRGKKMRIRNIRGWIWRNKKQNNSGGAEKVKVTGYLNLGALIKLGFSSVGIVLRYIFSFVLFKCNMQMRFSTWFFFCQFIANFTFPPLLLCVLHRGAADCSQAIALNIDWQLTPLLVRSGNKLSLGQRHKWGDGGFSFFWCRHLKTPWFCPGVMQTYYAATYCT